jgi:hypothetical protein
VVIIDHADYLENPSQNILLKRLEEPADNLYFILLAENRGGILKTILSRCRYYKFNKLDPLSVKSILKEKFNEEISYQSIKHFLLKDDETYSDNTRPIAVKIMKQLFSKNVNFSDLSLSLQSCHDKRIVKSILNEMITILEKEYLRRQVEIHSQQERGILKNMSIINLVHLKQLMMDRYKKIDIYNLNPQLVLEGILYPVKVMIKNDRI